MAPQEIMTMEYGLAAALIAAFVTTYGLVLAQTAGLRDELLRFNRARRVRAVRAAAAGGLLVAGVAIAALATSHAALRNDAATAAAQLAAVRQTLFELRLAAEPLAVAAAPVEPEDFALINADRALVRASPDGPVRFVLDRGARVRLGEARQAQGREWRWVNDSAGREGWMAVSLLDRG